MQSIDINSIKRKLANAVNLGEQGALEDIPLPQVLVEETTNELHALLYSMLKPRSVHDQLLRKIRRILATEDISAKLIRSGVTYPLDNPKLRFLGSRLRLTHLGTHRV